MRSLRTALVASALLTSSSLGCGPRMPTSSVAQREYRARQALVDRIDRTIATAVDAIPGIDTSGFACATAITEECMRARSEQTTARITASRAFSREVLPSLAHGTEVLGIRVEYAQDGVPRGRIGTLEADSAGGRVGSVQAANGTTLDGRQIGWGLYQTAWQRGTSTVRHGDGKYHPGIELLWTREHGNARVTIRTVLLTDGWRRPDDWDDDLPPAR